jgi:hypothetical protein
MEMAVEDSQPQDNNPAKQELEDLYKKSEQHSKNIQHSFRKQQSRLEEIFTVHSFPVAGAQRLKEQFLLVGKTFEDLRELNKILTRSIDGYLAELDARKLEMFRELGIDDNIPDPSPPGEEIPPTTQQAEYHSDSSQGFVESTDSDTYYGGDEFRLPRRGRRSRGVIRVVGGEESGEERER